MNISDDAREAVAKMRNSAGAWGAHEKVIQSLLDRIRQQDAERMDKVFLRMSEQLDTSLAERDTLRAERDQAIRELDEARAQLAEQNL